MQRDKKLVICLQVRCFHLGREIAGPGGSSPLYLFFEPLASKRCSHVGVLSLGDMFK